MTTEYTLVFRRVMARGGQAAGQGASRARVARWMVARPAIAGAAPISRTDAPRLADVAQVFVVPICSALGLDGIAYEHFLTDCGVLQAATALLGRSHLTQPDDAETARREVQALVMAAEVQHIIDRMSA